VVVVLRPVRRVDFAPRGSVQDQDRRDDVRIGRSDPQQRSRWTLGEAASALPVAEGFATDAHHFRELPARLTELAANLSDIDRLELEPVSCPEPMARPTAREHACQDQRVAHGISAPVGPLSGLVEHIAIVD
jgi:hypothetical protein